MPRPRSHFSIRRHTYPSGHRVWITTGTRQDGTRVRRFFEDRNEAERFRQNTENADKVGDEMKTFARTSLSDRQVREAEVAFNMLKELPVGSLIQAIDFCKNHYVAPETSRTVHEVFEELMEDKLKVNLRKRSYEELRARLGKLDQSLGKVPVRKVTGKLLESLIPTGASPRTRNNYLTKWGQFFNWAIKRGYCESNPAESLSKAKTDAADNIALSLAQVKNVLKAAWATELRSMVALQLFAGLRKEEVVRLDWAQVDTEEMIVTVKAEGAKKRSARAVELPECALPWLDMSKPIVPINQRKYFRQIRKEAGIVDRKYDNVFRHTALSFYSAKHKSLDKTLLWGGTGVGPFFNNYKALVKTREIDPYWGLTPQSLGLE